VLFTLTYAWQKGQLTVRLPTVTIDVVVTSASAGSRPRPMKELPPRQQATVIAAGHGSFGAGGYIQRGTSVT